MARTTEKLEEVKESCEKLGSPEVTILEADMLKEDDLAKISQAVSPGKEESPPLPLMHALFDVSTRLRRCLQHVSRAVSCAPG